MKKKIIVVKENKASGLRKEVLHNIFCSMVLCFWWK